MTDYGTIQRNGETITLTQDAYATSRVLTEYPDWQQGGGDGPSYIVEYAAHGIGEDGRDVEVRWHFEVAREGRDTEAPGAYPYETEECDYDWDDVEDVVDV